MKPLKSLVLTNNEIVFTKYKDMITVLYKDISYKEILIEARDLIHKGYKLKTHPLSGSVKPNENPFKSMILSIGDELDVPSLVMIENSIATYDKFSYQFPVLTEKMLSDFSIVDLTLIESALIYSI